MSLILLLLLGIALSKSQNLQPALVVSDENGAVSAKKVFIGYLGCNNSSLEDAKRIDLLENKVNQLEAQIKEYNATPPSSVRIESLENQVSQLHLNIRKMGFVTCMTGNSIRYF